MLSVDDEPAEGSADNPDADSTAEELDAEDPGLQQLARRMTENALGHVSPSLDSRAQAGVGAAQQSGRCEAQQDGIRVSGQQIGAVDEMQQLQVSFCLHSV